MKNIKLGVKLIGGFILTAIIVLIVGLTAMVQQNKMHDLAEELADDHMPSIKYLLHIESDLAAIAGFMDTLLSSDATKGMREEIHQQLLDRRKDYGAAKDEFLKLNFAKEVETQWQALMADIGKWVEINNKAVDISKDLIARDIVNPQELAEYMDKFEIAHLSLLANVGKLLSLNQQFEGGTDGTSCSLGKWIANPSTQNKEIMALVEKLTPIHLSLHAKVADIKQAIANGGIYQAKEMAQKELFPISEQVFELVHDMTTISNAAHTAFNEMDKLLTEDAKGPKAKVFETIKSLVQTADEEAQKTKVQAENVASRTTIITSIGLVAGVVLALALGIFLTTGITRPLTKGVDLSQAMAKGDMTKIMDVDQKDEIGILAKALNAMATSLRAMISDIGKGVASVDKSSAQLAAISNQMSSGAEETANRANQVAAASEEMSANQNSVAAAMEQASVNVSMVAAAAEEMNATITEISINSTKAKEITTTAVDQSQKASERVDELGRAADEINKVTEAITEISEQTNLLALNATIEAARAGEAGKGFAVVANEIKDLAKQTADATLDIKNKITGIQQATGITVKEINEIAEVIADVDQIVTTIATAVEEQTATTREIAENVNQASSGITEVNENVSQSSAVAEEIAADIAAVSKSAGEMSTASSQVKKSAEELSVIADQLKEMIEKFQV